MQTIERLPKLAARIPARQVSVWVGNGLSSRLGRLLVPSAKDQQLALVTDRNVHALYGSSVSAALKRAGWRVQAMALPAGERIKSASVIRNLHEEWFKRRFDRTTPVVALGGGTIGDAVGFAAATFLRGLPLWHIPTTIVGQVDSAIGGKVGINHARGKNLIGCFYQPAGVVIDPSFLTTLPAREIRSGLAEVVKYGVIADSTLFRSCERMVSRWVSRHPLDTETIRRCDKIKLRVVERDEHDMGLRHFLNFGHTLGHAFERWGGYRRLRHGEAVTMGMVGAGFIAATRGLWSHADQERLEAVCRWIAPGRRIGRFEPARITPYLRTDKKRRAGHINWVIPVQIGRVILVDDVSDKEVREAIRYIRAWLTVRD